MNLAPWTAKLRAWQERAFVLVMARTEPDTLIMATPGSGKTTLGLRCGHALLADRAADRLLVVCPTDHLRGQWARAAVRVGLHLDPALGNDQAQEATDYHGAVVTYQQVSQCPALFVWATARRRTFVILDELHHAGDCKSWGQALQTAFGEASKRLALSGTPFRSDSTPIPFVRYEEGISRPDFVYGYGESLRDGVCRAIRFPAYEGDLAWRVKGIEYQARFADADILNTTTGRRNKLTATRTQQRLKTVILKDSWLQTVLVDAHQRLQTLRAGEHPAAGGLIIAMNQDHARQVAELVQRVTGYRPWLAISDDPEASATIQAFRDSRAARWLVAVNMVSEGVDIPRLRVGVYATNVLTEMYFRQVVGRFVRMQVGLPRSQSASLYVPHDPTLAGYATSIQAERDHVLAEAAAPTEVEETGTGRGGSTFEPVSGVARAETVIGDGARDLFEGEIQLEDPVPLLHDRKESLRDQHHRLVGAVARTCGQEPRWINLELIKRTGSRIDSATVAQLEQRIRMLTLWKDRGIGRW